MQNKETIQTSKVQDSVSHNYYCDKYNYISTFLALLLIDVQAAHRAHSSVVAGVWNTLIDFNLTVVTLITIHAVTGIVAKPVLRKSERA